MIISSFSLRQTKVFSTTAGTSHTLCNRISLWTTRTQQRTNQSSVSKLREWTQQYTHVRGVSLSLSRGGRRMCVRDLLKLKFKLCSQVAVDCHHLRYHEQTQLKSLTHPISMSSRTIWCDKLGTKRFNNKGIWLLTQATQRWISVRTARMVLRGDHQATWLGSAAIRSVSWLKTPTWRMIRILWIKLH